MNFKLKILITCLIIISANKLNAQYIKECGTPSSKVDFLKTIAPENFKTSTTTRVIKMFLIIYSDDNGSNQAMTEEDVKTEIKYADSVYSIGDICFSIVGVDYRNSTTYNNALYGTTDYSGQTLSNNVFTVFVVNTIDQGIFGWAPGIPSNYMITKKVGFGVRRTFLHEMGHALGLDHTFKGTGHNVDNPGTDELVNGSNGTTAGDFVADTPADPYERCGTGISGCTYPYHAPSCQDANGASFNPQMTNYMSYWPNYGCNRSIFTAGQYSRMRNTIDNSGVLQPLLAPDLVAYSGGFILTGFVTSAAKTSINISNYSVLGSVNATYSAGVVIVSPGTSTQATQFVPSGSGVVQLLGSYCH